MPNMLGKLIVAAVLCVFVAQACLAAPQLRQEEGEEEFNPLQFEGSAETRITQCRQNLRNVIVYVSNVVYHASALFTEVLASVSDGFGCVLRPSELLQCIPDLFTDTFEGLFESTKMLITNIISLIGSIVKAFITCVNPRGYRSQDIFLLGNNNHEF